MVSEFSTLCNRRRVRAYCSIISVRPLWDQFSALLPDRPEFDPNHPLGCHKRRIPDRIVFRLVVEALVHGSGYERIAVEGCSDWTIRDRVKPWSALGLFQDLHRLALAAYDRMIGLELDDLSADGCHTKAPVKGEARPGRSAEEVLGRDAATRRLRRTTANFPTGPLVGGLGTLVVAAVAPRGCCPERGGVRPLHHCAAPRGGRLGIPRLIGAAGLDAGIGRSVLRGHGSQAFVRVRRHGLEPRTRGLRASGEAGWYGEALVVGGRDRGRLAAWAGAELVVVEHEPSNVGSQAYDEF